MFACLHAPGNLPLLVECARYFSPLIEETLSDTVVFDIRGLRLIYGTPEQIAQEIWLRIGIPANLAVASNPDAAIYAARGIKGLTVIAPGKEAAVLAPLPLLLLGGSPELASALTLWGIRTFGSLAALPPMGVAGRLGDEGLALQRLARGEGNRLLRTTHDPLEFRDEMEPECTLDLVESVLLLVGRMLNDLCASLVRHALATNELHLRLKLEQSVDYTAVLRLPVPMLDSKIFLKLLHLELNRRPPGAAVEKIFLELKPVEPRTVQHGLFIPAAPEPEKLEITLARIRSLVGSTNLGAPVITDTHRPDSFQMGPLFKMPSGKAQCPALQLKLMLRRFRPPVRAQVWRSPQGNPARILSSKAEGKVAACAGPWLTSGGWWERDPWDHAQWDVEMASGGLFRICCNVLTGMWGIEGSYD
jgi:protein ImuB